MKMFGIQSPTHLLSEIDTALAEFRTAKGTTFRNLFFLLSGLNHLREWIAPGYSHKDPADTPNKVFYNSIYHHCPEWKLVNSLCNGLKHFDPYPYSTSDNASKLLVNFNSLSGVTSLEHGHPQKFTVKGRDAIDILAAARNYYEKNWFAKQGCAKI